MYAVIRSGGKQYRVKEGETLRLEKLEGEVGSAVGLEALMVADGDTVCVGQDCAGKAKVAAEIVEHGRRDKVTTIKFKRRKHHMKRQGHRQYYTAVKITKIAL